MRVGLLVSLLLVSCSGRMPRQADDLDVFNPRGFSQRLETKARLKAAPAPMPNSTTKNLTSTSSGAVD